jgi:hypothetical protein
MYRNGVNMLAWYLAFAVVGSNITELEKYPSFMAICLAAVVIGDATGKWWPK